MAAASQISVPLVALGDPRTPLGRLVRISTSWQAAIVWTLVTSGKLATAVVTRSTAPPQSSAEALVDGAAAELDPSVSGAAAESAEIEAAVDEVELSAAAFVVSVPPPLEPHAAAQSAKAHTVAANSRCRPRMRKRNRLKEITHSLSKTLAGVRHLRVGQVPPLQRRTTHDKTLGDHGGRANPCFPHD